MPYIIALLVVIALAAAGAMKIHDRGFSKGYDDRDLSCAAEKAEKDKKISGLESEISRMKLASLKAETDALKERDHLRQNADRLAEELAATNSKFVTFRERTNRELSRRASATRLCFSAGVAGLLNAPAGVPSGQGDQAGQAPGGAADASQAASPGADGPGTSEQAAAHALNLARTSFAACRAQLEKVLIATENPPIE